MSSSFVHLHLHTEYSMLDGAARIQDVVATAAADGQPAIGITDHGNMYGVLDFYRAAREADLTPVIGIEAYIVTTSRFDRPRRAEHDIYHLTLLARDDAGLPQPHQGRRRTRTSTASSTSPASTSSCSSATTRGWSPPPGCLGGAVCQRLLADDYAGARELAARFQSIFGRDSFFIELQDHGLPEQHRVNPQLCCASRATSARRCSPPTTATTRTATTPSRTTRCCACRPGPRSTTRTASSSTPTSST